ncbi:MAG: hypothetical protein AMJ81_01905 [Phycisphaerae bacterium SM23_33]|nr:MAG: hypothetical protein AMJ81_01905 [Phycisphaerae bacterium SM23_33]
MEQYRSQPLGQVPYPEAFQAARTVFSQYFPVASADPQTGKIIGRPKLVEAAPDRLLGVTPARQVAKMRIREKKGGQVFAEVRVDVQRQDVEAFGAMRPVTVDNELPSRTPAQDVAPISAEQNQAWQTTGRDAAKERDILMDLLRRVSEKS